MTEGRPNSMQGVDESLNYIPALGEYHTGAHPMMCSTRDNALVLITLLGMLTPVRMACIAMQTSCIFFASWTFRLSFVTLDPPRLHQHGFLEHPVPHPRNFRVCQGASRRVCRIRQHVCRKKSALHNWKLHLCAVRVHIRDSATDQRLRKNGHASTEHHDCLRERLQSRSNSRCKA